MSLKLIYLEVLWRRIPIHRNVRNPVFEFFLEAIYLGRVVVLSPKIVINLPGTYDKISFK